MISSQQDNLGALSSLQHTFSADGLCVQVRRRHAVTAADAFGDSKVADPPDAASVYQHVGALDVAVNDPHLGVQEGEPSRDV